ncbi:peroxiredoxin [Rhodomicrobium lacus]|uniref:peroxiredoxin n=1 Tax=Rhodomicrobium lacus TaxID=2498452 RepID=UPI000F8CFEE2|nr:peroxiredoxin [Rhodomicrobium lacus]
MTIAPGTHLPHAKFKIMTASGPADVSTDELFGGKKAVLFAVPGAFTPTCSLAHLPGFIEHADDFKAKGVDVVACTAVNDVFVLDAWAKSTGAQDRIVFLADGSGDFAKATGLDLDAGAFGLGLRSKRYAMLLEDGVVKALHVEENPSVAEASSAEKLLAEL